MGEGEVGGEGDKGGEVADIVEATREGIVQRGNGGFRNVWGGKSGIG